MTDKVQHVLCKYSTKLPQTRNGSNHQLTRVRFILPTGATSAIESNAGTDFVVVPGPSPRTELARNSGSDTHFDNLPSSLAIHGQRRPSIFSSLKLFFMKYIQCLSSVSCIQPRAHTPSGLTRCPSDQENERSHSPIHMGCLQMQGFHNLLQVVQRSNYSASPRILAH